VKIGRCEHEITPRPTQGVTDRSDHIQNVVEQAIQWKSQDHEERG